MGTTETVLNERGMSNVWQTQCQGIGFRWLKESVKVRLQDQFVQRTDNLINVDSKCFLYKDIKQDHKFEDYLVNLPRCFYVPILKLRSCNYRLPVERGRYSNIPRERQYCDLCNENIIGDKYHFVLECKHGSMVQYRNQYLPKFYRHGPSMLKFVTLMKNVTENHKLAIQFGSLLRKSFSLLKYQYLSAIHTVSCDLCMLHTCKAGQSLINVLYHCIVLL